MIPSVHYTCVGEKRRKGKSEKGADIAHLEEILNRFNAS